MSLYRHNVGWSGGNFKGEDKKLGGGGDMYDMGDFSDGEEGEGGAPSNLGDISLAPSKITRVATYPMADTNTGIYSLLMYAFKKLAYSCCLIHTKNVNAVSAFESPRPQGSPKQCLSITHFQIWLILGPR